MQMETKAMDELELQRLISEGLIRQRLLRGMRPARAAELAGVSTKVYCAAERGEAPLAKEALATLCRQWGVSLFSLCEPRHIPRAAFLTCKPKNKTESARRDEDVWEVYKWARDYAFIERELERTVEPPAKLFQQRDPVEAARFVRGTFWEKGGFTPESMPSVLARHGIKVCVKPFLAAKQKGFSFHDPDCGWVIAVNANPSLSAEEQARAAAHELGHIVLGTHDHYCTHGTPEEKDADAFASELLLPELSFRAFWEDNGYRAPYARVLAVKHAFKVPYEMVVYRIAARAPKAKRSAIYAFYNNLRNRHAENMGSSPEAEPGPVRFPFVPNRFVSLAYLACDRGIITHSKLAELLHTTVSQLRREACLKHAEERGHD